MISKIKKIERFVKKNLSQLNLVHTEAMRPIALRLAKLEGADQLIVDTAVLFHDIAKDEVLNQHAEEGAKICEKFLIKLNFDADFINRVVYCVRVHSSPWRKGQPKLSTIEAKVMFDADMLQQLSAFGIAKHIIKYHDKKFYELVKAVLGDLDKACFLLTTKTGKELGRKKIKKVKKFLDNSLSGC
jgi:HD superfamily phosphodiesterase